MRKLFATISLVLLAGAGLFAQEFNDVPRLWKWVGKDEVAFTYDGSFKGEKDFEGGADAYIEELCRSGRKER